MPWLLLLLAACDQPSDTADTGPDPFIAPDQAGPWIAGTYEDLAPGPGGIELEVQVWFPAVEASDTLYSYDGYFQQDARADGVPDCAAPRPVLVFSHGNTGVRFQ